MLGDYARDAQFKADFQRWVNGFWLEKEQLLQALVERDKNLRKL
jgi:hypothetical protein